MKVDRVVCDTDVLISAAIVEQGKPRRVLDYVLDHGTLVLSAALYAEVATRLLRPKFWKYLSEESRDYYLKRLELLGNFVAIPGTLTGAVRDPDDDKFLETAIVGEAECLVTGDGDEWGALTMLRKALMSCLLLAAAFLLARIMHQV